MNFEETQMVNFAFQSKFIIFVLCTFLDIYIYIYIHTQFDFIFKKYIKHYLIKY